MSTDGTGYICVQGNHKGLQIFAMNKSLDEYWWNNLHLSARQSQRITNIYNESLI